MKKKKDFKRRKKKKEEFSITQDKKGEKDCLPSFKFKIVPQPSMTFYELRAKTKNIFSRFLEIQALEFVIARSK